MNSHTTNHYLLLPFNFTRIDNNKILLVNMVGEYLPVRALDFDKLISYKLGPDEDLFSRLKGKHFITNSLTDPSIDLLAVKYRTKKEFLFDFTALHMFVVTLRCNHKCTYCHASSRGTNEKKYDMSLETAKRAVDISFLSPSKRLKIEFQGGEPLLNLEAIKFIIEYANKKAKKEEKKIEFVVCTNLTLIDDDMLRYFADNNVLISTSIDGPQNVHNKNRLYRDGKGSYKDVMRAMDKVRKYFERDKISALMTTTKYSLDHSMEIVDEYINNGISTIFLRPLNPFGYAYQKLDKLAYTPSEFVEFFKKVLSYILDINTARKYLEEAFSSLLLTRILTPFSTGFVDLQFPAGTGISGVIYDYNGNVYPSDEARMLASMGDNSFYLGNVNRDSYEDIFNNKLIRNIVGDSCAESLPGCCDCAFQMYCGSDPIRNYITHRDSMGHRPTCDMCSINKGVIKHLFDIILENNVDSMNIFWSWLTGRSLTDISIYS